MSNETNAAVSRVETMIGWDSFDPAAVERIRAGDAQAIQRGEGGGIACPLAGCARKGEWLPWLDGNPRSGAAPHGTPAVSFRSSPTFIHADPRANLPLAPWVVDAATRPREGGKRKAETGRLGNENSEDAVTANVFVGLQDAGLLGEVIALLTGRQATGDATLYLWGNRVAGHDLEDWPELTAALKAVEHDFSVGAQHTEPDAVLHAPGVGWVFVEAKLTSATSTYEKRAYRVEEWAQRYADRAPDLFDAATIRAREASAFPEQLLRNVAVASALGRTTGEPWHVVGLFRAGGAGPVLSDALACLRPDHHGALTTAAWEQLHGLAAQHASAGAPVRRYLERKSARLRPAFPKIAKTGASR